MRRENEARKRKMGLDQALGELCAAFEIDVRALATMAGISPADFPKVERLAATALARKHLGISHCPKCLSIEPDHDGVPDPAKSLIEVIQ